MMMARPRPTAGAVWEMRFDNMIDSLTGFSPIVNGIDCAYFGSSSAHKNFFSDIKI